jgi:amino acid adenylation domain-containing protein
VVQILDTTLREGEQSAGVYFSPDRKLSIARLLDEIGVDYIEAGNPAVDAEIADAVTRVASAGLRAKVGAHARCKTSDVRRALDCGVSFLGIFLNVSGPRLREDYQLTLDQAIAQLTETITYARGQQDDLLIRYTVEDAVRSPLPDVIRAATAAARAGADIISLADTTGYATPFVEARSLARYVAALKCQFARDDLQVRVAVHCHNDMGLALTNALEAYRSGAELIDATVLGLGERAGIVDLAELMASLREFFNEGRHWRLNQLAELYALVSASSGRSIPRHRPVTGEDAFTHHAGVHVKAMKETPTAYQSLDPGLFGRTWAFCLGVQSGHGSVEAALERIGRREVITNRPLVSDILREIKRVAKRGRPIELVREFEAIVERCAMRQLSEHASRLVDTGHTEQEPSCPAQPATPAPSFTEFRKEDIEQAISSRFENQVDRYRHQVAIRSRSQEFTYEALNQSANRIARAIQAKVGEGEEPIALLLGESGPLIAAMLGVLKTGKFYVPLDPYYPLARNAVLLQDAGARLLVTDDRCLGMATALANDSVQVVNAAGIDPQLSSANLNLSVSPGALAYILYTSGSTGEPKGVTQTHRTVLHNIMKQTNGARISPNDRVTLLPSCSFTASVSDIYGALLNGATLCPFALKELGLTGLADWLIQEEITVYHSVPTVFRQFVDLLMGQAEFPRLRLIKLGGEPVLKRDVELFREFFSPECILYVGLGATEMNIIRQYFIDRQTELSGSTAPVGYAVEDTEILLLDEAGEEVERGDVGEIAIRSRYLSPGYWRKPELTRAAFRADPAEGSQRIYLTGDLGRMLEDGCLVHLGRRDSQVKIRGHRIDVSEIELALLEHPAVREAAVVAQENPPDEQRLAAYIVARGEPAPRSTELRRFLQKRLPEYMVPAAVMRLDALPLTRTGKVDRHALPTIGPSRPDLGDLVPPHTPIEAQLVSIWGEVLGIEAMGVDDDFFDLGGHSLLASRILSRVRDVFQVELSVRTLIERSTVANLAVAVIQALAKEVEQEELTFLLAEQERTPDGHSLLAGKPPDTRT